MDRNFLPGKVSVITPVYNAEKYLARTLDSVLAQTYKDIEIVLVDDRSTDNSANIIREYQAKYSDVIYYLQERNMGAGVARNKALELATGQYVAFLDSDDIWLPDKILRQVELMQDMKTPFVYAAIEMIDEKDNIIKTKRSICEKCDYEYLLRNTIIATSSVIIDRIALGDFRMPLRRGGQDYATWLKLLRDGTVARGINEVLVKYRLTPDTLSSNKLKSVKQVWDIQVSQEKIKKTQVIYNVLFFIYHGIKKYLL